MDDDVKRCADCGRPIPKSTGRYGRRCELKHNPPPKRRFRWRRGRWKPVPRVRGQAGLDLPGDQPELPDEEGVGGE